MKRSGQYRCRSSPRSSASRTGDLQNCADDTRLRCPLRGYWARIQVGQSVKRPPLPPVSQANLSTIEISLRERQPAIEGTATEGDGVPTIVVAQDRAISHPIILLIEHGHIAEVSSESEALRLSFPGGSLTIEVYSQ